MKIVQSFWSKPSIGIINGRNNGGWLDKRYHFMSWALSCLLLTKFYRRVELVTDQLGFELLVKKLDLPYTNVELGLNGLDIYHNDLWCLGKLWTYSIQKEPFIHVDCDFYLFEKFEPVFERHCLITQGKLNIDELRINEWLQPIILNFKYVPEIIRTYYLKECRDIYNPGIFGGTNVDFISSYATEGIAFVSRNIEIIQNRIDSIARDYTSNFGINNSEIFNTIIESYLFSALVSAGGYNVHCLSDDSSIDKYQHCHLYGQHRRRFLHPIYNAKRNINACFQLENMLRRRFPDYYYRILSLLDEHEI